MIINQNCERIIIKLERMVKDLILEGGSFSDITVCVQDEMNALGRSIMEGIVDEYNQVIRDSGARKKAWHIVRTDERQLLTPMGEVKVARDYYKHKTTGEHKYLLDNVMDLPSHDRIDTSLKADLIRRSEKGSYAKAANANPYATVSRQTVLHKIREAGALIHRPAEELKKKVPVLYVEADEDHVSYQDGKSGIVKLIYLHEGAKRKNKRVELQKTFYFACGESSSEDMWMEVADYIFSKYDTDVIKHMYLSGDGASWIRGGMDYLVKPVFILDQYHQNNYVKQVVGSDKAKQFELLDLLKNGSKLELLSKLESHYAEAETETHKKRIQDAHGYFKRNWDGISNARKYPDVLGCSAEGHVSHVLSERMSSRPMGWSRIGADQMGRLRAFVRNGGDVGKVIKERQKQKKILNKRTMISIEKKVVGGFEKMNNVTVLSSGKMNAAYQAVKVLQQTRWTTF